MKYEIGTCGFVKDNRLKDYLNAYGGYEMEAEPKVLVKLTNHSAMLYLDGEHPYEVDLGEYENINELLDMTTTYAPNEVNIGAALLKPEEVSSIQVGDIIWLKAKYIYKVTGFAIDKDVEHIDDDSLFPLLYAGSGTVMLMLENGITLAIGVKDGKLFKHVKGVVKGVYNMFLNSDDSGYNGGYEANDDTSSSEYDDEYDSEYDDEDADEWDDWDEWDNY